MTPDLDCIDLVEITTEYFEGTLPPAEVARLEAHLTECDGCTEFVRQMRVTQDTLGRLDADDVPRLAFGKAVARAKRCVPICERAVLLTESESARYLTI